MAGSVLVVGAGPGLGLAVARRFAREGHPAGLLARSPDRVAALSAALAAEGLPAAGVVADVADPPSLRAGLAAAVDRLGPPAVLVYNPSRWVPGTGTTIDPEDFLDGIRVGVVGLLVAVQELAPALRAAARGSVLVTGGGTALRPTAASAGLAAQKAAVRALTFALADELGPQGVHVATVTVAGTLAPTGHFAPERVAEEFWRLHAQPPDSWQTEVVYS